ncbi:hypothetical protein Dda_2228 [Drechslerella dactyloides]|uniref:PD-(D/E)XK nuclease-like domain-containing protein n=1 Tax=Drechslerella dactyloides TaxID=74499 RepID=A0AAD6J4Y0_DREDA|nr:hypothetical protein Dda_2228 [Drechslerella dactyloides]
MSTSGSFNLINQTGYSFAVIDLSPAMPIPAGFGDYPRNIPANSEVWFYANVIGARAWYTPDGTYDKKVNLCVETVADGDDTHFQSTAQAHQFNHHDPPHRDINMPTARRKRGLDAVIEDHRNKRARYDNTHDACDDEPTNSSHIFAWLREIRKYASPDFSTMDGAGRGRKTALPPLQSLHLDDRQPQSAPPSAGPKPRNPSPKRAYSEISRGSNASSARAPDAARNLTSIPRKIASANTRRSSSSSRSSQISTGTKSRNTSPTKLTASTTISVRRSRMRSCDPPFIFGHNHYLLQGKKMPMDVVEMRRLFNSDILVERSLDRRKMEELKDAYPDEHFTEHLFADTPKHGDALWEHVEEVWLRGNENFHNDSDEASWSKLVEFIWEGIPRRGLKAARPSLKVTPAISRTISDNVRSTKAPDLKSDILIEANPYFPSPFQQSRDSGLRPPPEIEHSFSPSTHPSSEYCPAFCAIEVKAERGDAQEAQTQTAVLGTAILMKAREIGAAEDVVPCVPAVMAIGKAWSLNLIYEEADKGVVIARPWPIGETYSILGTLKVVLAVEAMREYASGKWWAEFVNGSCRTLLDQQVFDFEDLREGDVVESVN